MTYSQNDGRQYQIYNFKSTRVIVENSVHDRFFCHVQRVENDMICIYKGLAPAIK
jgi:hypothetical protein